MEKEDGKSYVRGAKDMRVAVLMSTYNGERYIREQIESIVSQKGDFDLDLWVRDDGSSDSTIRVLNEYQEKKKLRWYSGENMGPGKSFIDLLYRVKGYDYYAFSDQDDVWLQGKIQKGIDLICGCEKETLYFCNAEYVDQNLRPLGGTTYKNDVPTDYFSAILNPGYLGCTMIFNAKLAATIQSHSFPQVLFIHDAFVARVCAAVGGKIKYDKNTYIKYRQHGNNVIGSTVGKNDAVKRRIKMILEKPKVGVADELRDLNEIYTDEIGIEQKKWIDTIVNYKRSFWSKCELAFSKKTNFTSYNMRITIALKILLGNL